MTFWKIRWLIYIAPIRPEDHMSSEVSSETRAQDALSAENMTEFAKKIGS